MREFEQRADYKSVKPEPQMVLRENGIDTITNLNLPGIKYETDCFEMTLGRYPNQFVLGPHLIDHMFSRRGLSSEARPDAIILDVEPEQWTINRVVEYKSGNGIKAGTKVNGFSRLFDFFRERPLALPIMLKHTIGKHVNVPSRIVVPDNSEISVTFVTPRKRRIMAGDTFKVDNVAYPFQKQAA